MAAEGVQCLRAWLGERPRPCCQSVGLAWGPALQLSCPPAAGEGSVHLGPRHQLMSCACASSRFFLVAQSRAWFLCVPRRLWLPENVSESHRFSSILHVVSMFNAGETWQLGVDSPRALPSALCITRVMPALGFLFSSHKAAQFSERPECLCGFYTPFHLRNLATRYQRGIICMLAPI